LNERLDGSKDWGELKSCRSTITRKSEGSLCAKKNWNRKLISDLLDEKKD
jgi:hypothetical protein